MTDAAVPRAYPPAASWVELIAWLYGAHGPNFVETMLRLAAERDTLSVLDDQRGQRTWTVDLAAATLKLVTPNAPFGIYHGTSSGESTWYRFARAIFAELGLDPVRVLLTTSDAFVWPALGPGYRAIGRRVWQRWGPDLLPPWQDSLKRAVPIVSLS